MDYWDIYLLMFPFLQWVTHWQYFLRSNYCNQGELSVDRLADRLKKDLAQPENLYDKFVSSKESFIRYITEPI